MPYSFVLFYYWQYSLYRDKHPHYGKKAFDNDKEKLVKLQENQKSKFGKFIFALYKTNKDADRIEGSLVNLNSEINCIDATYRLDVIEV